MSVARTLWPLTIIARLCACADPDPCAEPGPGTVCLVAGSGEAAFDGDGRQAEQTALFLPSAARRGPDGLLYIMDYNNHRLRRLRTNGIVDTVAGDGVHLGATVGVPAVQSSLENPVDFDFVPDGRAIFVSAHDPRVLVVEPDNTLTVVSGSTMEAQSTADGDGGPASFARYVELAGIAVASDGTIYVADAAANRVRMIRDGIVKTLAGIGARGYSGDGGPATNAQLNGPTAIALDQIGNVYIADSLNSAIRRVSPDGIITTVAGTGQRGFSGDGGPATSAQLAQPEGIAFDADGRMYIGDRFNSRVRAVAPDGVITTVAGSGMRGVEGDGDLAIDASFGYLTRVHLDGRDLLITDQTNHRIRRVTGPL